MAKRQLDQLDLDMIQCEKDGYGVRYGAWKAARDAGLLGKPTAKLPSNPPSNPPEITGQQKRLYCIRCGKPVPDNTRQRLYCGDECRKLATAERAHEKYLQRIGSQGPTARICPVCGKDYFSTDRRKLTCSPICSRVARAERVKKYQKQISAKENAENGI